MPADTRHYPCNCCGFYTLTEPSYGSYEVCPVCLWEDDPLQLYDPDFEEGANRTSLAKARDNYVEIGACHPESKGQVRAPRLDERPPTCWLEGLEPMHHEIGLRAAKTQLLAISRGILSREIGTFDGCIAIDSLAYLLNVPELEDALRTFKNVASEIDEWPTAKTRHLWSEEVLEIKDREADEYETSVRQGVADACRELEGKLPAQISKRLQTDPTPNQSTDP